MEKSGLRADRHVSLTLKEVVLGLLAVAATVAGATFAVTDRAGAAHVAALQLQAKSLDERVRSLEKELDRYRQERPAPSQGPAIDSQRTGEPRTAVFEVRFTHPKPDSAVPQFVDVEYAVNGALPAGHQPLLFVRDPLGQYWPWGTAPSGRHSRVQIGVATDVGRTFELVVVITQVEPSFGRPLRSLPEGIETHLISVKRK